jgi:predicted outer membrane protein
MAAAPWLARCAGAMLALFAAVAQCQPAAAPARLTPEQKLERGFLREAASANRFEAEAAKLALARSNNGGVRSFAASVLNQHNDNGNTLLHLLHARGMAWPIMDNDQRKALNRLGKLAGPKFDREFMELTALKWQQGDIRFYERVAQGARDPAVKAFAERNVPTLRYHLAMAERLAPPDSRLAGGRRGAFDAAALAPVAMQKSSP